MRPEAPKGFFFDLDGLLVDSERIYFDGWKAGFEKTGIPFDQDFVKSFAGLSGPETKRLIMERCHDEKIHDKIRQYREELVYERLAADQLPAKPYAAEALQAIKAAGKITGIATSCPHERNEAILKHHDLKKWVDFKADSLDTKQFKPEPDLYNILLKKAGLKPDEVIAFEDSMSGYEAAHAAGIYTVLIPDRQEIDPEKLENAEVAADLSVVLTILDQ